jgi:hypothetical protein
MLEDIADADSYDSDVDPSFIPPSMPDPDLDYDEYSDGEIPEDETKELLEVIAFQSCRPKAKMIKT